MRTKFNLGQHVFTVKRATPNTMPKIEGPFVVKSVILREKSERCGVVHVFKTKGHDVIDSKRLFLSLRSAARELNRQLAIRAKTL